jgi:hypothetical protein
VGGEHRGIAQEGRVQELPADTDIFERRVFDLGVGITPSLLVQPQVCGYI